MKLSRDVSAKELIKTLSKFGYEITRQKGSHIRLTRKTESSSHHVTVPNHDPLKLGTLSEILSQVSTNLGISKEEFFK